MIYFQISKCQNVLFYEESANHTAQNGTNAIFTRSTPHFTGRSWVLLFSSLIAKYPQLNEFMSIYRKQGKFELQVFDRLLKKIGKIYFWVHK